MQFRFPGSLLALLLRLPFRLTSIKSNVLLPEYRESMTSALVALLAATVLYKIQRLRRFESNSSETLQF